MKVLVVSNMYPTREYPVGGIFVHEQVKALRKSGIDARVASGRPLWLPVQHPRLSLKHFLREVIERRRSFTWDDYDDVPVARFNYFAGGFARPAVYPWLYANALGAILPAITREFPYEIVHTHTAYLDGRAGALAAKVQSVPMVLTEHTGPFSIVTENPKLRRHTVFGMLAADQIVAVSKSLAADIVRNLPQVDPARIMIVPNGVDSQFFDPSAPRTEVPSDSRRGQRIVPHGKRELVLMSFLGGLRQSLLEKGDNILSGSSLVDAIDNAIQAGFGEGPHLSVLDELRTPVSHLRLEQDDKMKTILWVGHLEPVKRVDRLLVAFEAATQKQPNLRLRLVGGGILEDELKRQAAALNITSLVTFRPHLDRAGVREEMRAADCLVISSDTETFAVVGIEAMAMGLPILATDCGGPADYVTDVTGVLTSNSTNGLREGLETLLGRMASFNAAEIRLQAVSQFDFQAVAGQLSRLYSDLTSGSGSSSSASQLKSIDHNDLRSPTLETGEDRHP